MKNDIVIQDHSASTYMIHCLLSVRLNLKKIIASCVSLVHRKKGCIFVFQKVAESHHCAEYTPQMASL